MIRCEAVKEQLSPFLDGALAGAEREEVGAHVALCSDCGRALDSLRGLSRLIKSLGQAPLPKGFFERLERRRAGPAAAMPRTPVYALALVAACVMLVVANRRQSDVPDASAPLAAAPAGTIAPAGKDAPVVLSAPESMVKAASSNAGGGAGVPMGARKAYTNEEMQNMLRAETRREGIVAANPGEDEEDQSQPFMGRQLGAADTREQAEDAIRQLQEMRHDVERGAGVKKNVPIKGNVAPVLSAAQAERGRALVQPDDAAKAAPPPKEAWDNGLSGQYSGGLEGTRTLMDDQAWSEVWARLSTDPKPAVDFSKKEVVAIFLGPRPTGGYAAKILWVGDEGPAFVVRWQEVAPAPGTAPPDGKTSPYTLKVIGRTDLPVRYEKQP